MIKIRVITVFPPLQKFVLEFIETRTTRIIEGKDRDTLRAFRLWFPTYAPQHCCSSTTPWPSEWFSISTVELGDPLSPLALPHTLDHHSLPYFEVVTHAKDLKHTFSVSRHGILDALVTYLEIKPVDMQPCQFSPVSQKVQCISVLTSLSYQTSSHPSSVTLSKTHSHQPEILYFSTLSPHSFSVY